MVRFIDIYDKTGTTKIGQIKHDSHEPDRKWTALDKSGRRLRDFAYLYEAEQEVHNDLSSDQSNTNHRTDGRPPPYEW